jgi:hypothetical protein
MDRKNCLHYLLTVLKQRDGLSETWTIERLIDEATKSTD